jgi:hypothetical protein
MLAPLFCRLSFWRTLFSAACLFYLSSLLAVHVCSLVELRQATRNVGLGDSTVVTLLRRATLILTTEQGFRGWALASRDSEPSAPYLALTDSANSLRQYSTRPDKWLIQRRQCTINSSKIDSDSANFERK